MSSLLSDSRMLGSLVVVKSALYEAGYDLNLSEEAFRQKLSSLGINQGKLNNIIFNIEKQIESRIKDENKEIIENVLDLVTMVYTR